MKILDRIKIAITALITLEVAKSQEEIGVLLGYSNKSSFSNLLHGRVNYPRDFIDRLCNLDQRLNRDWVANERGSILINSEKNIEYYNSKPSQDFDITPKKVIPWVSLQTISKLSEKKLINLNSKKTYIIPEFDDADFITTIEESSMLPKYKEGDLVACKFIDVENKIQKGNVYIFHHKSKGVLIKRLFPLDEAQKLECRSDNTTKYPPFIINIKNILTLTAIVGVIRLE